MFVNRGCKCVFALMFCFLAAILRHLESQAVTPLCNGIACTRPSALVSHSAGVTSRFWLACHSPSPLFRPAAGLRSSPAARACRARPSPTRPSVHVSHARGHTSSQSDNYIYRLHVLLLQGTNKRRRRRCENWSTFVGRGAGRRSLNVTCLYLRQFNIHSRHHHRRYHHHHRHQLQSHHLPQQLK